MALLFGNLVLITEVVFGLRAFCPTDTSASFCAKVCKSYEQLNSKSAVYSLFLLHLFTICVINGLAP